MQFGRSSDITRRIIPRFLDTGSGGGEPGRASAEEAIAVHLRTQEKRFNDYKVAFGFFKVRDRIIEISRLTHIKNDSRLWSYADAPTRNREGHNFFSLEAVMLATKMVPKGIEPDYVSLFKRTVVTDMPSRSRYQILAGPGF